MNTVIQINIVILLFLIESGGIGVQFETGPNHAPEQFLAPVMNDVRSLPAHKQDRLAPGTAKARIEIIKVDSSSGDIILTVRIKETLSYGPATPPLASGQEILVGTSSLDDVKNCIESGHRKLAVLQHVKKMEMFESAPDWNLLEIKKHNRSEKE